MELVSAEASHVDGCLGATSQPNTSACVDNEQRERLDRPNGK